CRATASRRFDSHLLCLADLHRGLRRAHSQGTRPHLSLVGCRHWLLRRDLHAAAPSWRGRTGCRRAVRGGAVEPVCGGYGGLCDDPDPTAHRDGGNGLHRALLLVVLGPVRVAYASLWLAPALMERDGGPGDDWRARWHRADLPDAELSPG